VVVAVNGPFQVDDVESRFSAAEPAYPPDIESAFQTLTENLRQRAAAGDEVPYESDGFKLVSFAAGSSVQGQGSAILMLSFAPTTYYRMLATNARLDAPLDVEGQSVTIRERYASSVDLRVRPVAELATLWSVGVSIVTFDGWLLVSQRGATATDPHMCGPAVAEGAARDLDADPTGAPDHFNAARRGLLEELGLALRPDELTWLTLSANPNTCSYALVGRVSSPLTLREVEDRRSAAHPRDGWETTQLHAVEFDPQAVARFCLSQDRRFSAFGLAAIMQTLLDEFGASRTEAAFQGAPYSVRSHLAE
jgi:hypothetical protein